MRKAILAGVVLAWCSSAWAAHTVNAVTYNPATGDVAIIVVPDNDDDIHDNTSPETRQVLVPVEIYDTLLGDALRYWLGQNEIDQGYVSELPVWAYAPVVQSDPPPAIEMGEAQ